MSQLIDSIRTHYEHDLAHHANALAPEDLPLSYEAITPAWLTAILCRDVAGAEIAGFSLDARDDGSTNRRRIFLRYNAAGMAAGLPPTVFCKASHDLLNRLNLGVTGAAHGEVTFYKSVRPLIELEIPKSYFAAYDPVTFNSMVILEDLGGQVEFCTHLTPMTLELAHDQVRLLADLHGKFQQSAEREPSSLDLPTWPQFFNNCSGHDLVHSCDNGFVTGEPQIPPALFARRAEIWPATLRSVERHLYLRPTLLQGDCHFAQWYITKPGKMGLGDWHGACWGHWARDLSYAMSTSLTVDQRRAWERELLQAYLSRLATHGVTVPFAEAMLYYRQNMMTALAWWTCTLTPADTQPSLMQPHETAREFVHRTSHAVHDLDALGSLS